jgi:hypothetical protein
VNDTATTRPITVSRQRSPSRFAISRSRSAADRTAYSRMPISVSPASLSVAASATSDRTVT